MFVFLSAYSTTQLVFTRTHVSYECSPFLHLTGVQSVHSDASVNVVLICSDVFGRIDTPANTSCGMIFWEDLCQLLGAVYLFGQEGDMG